MWKIVIPGKVTPSLNEFANKKNGWKIERGMYGWWSRHLKLSKMISKIPDATKARRITVVRYGKRYLDHDNFVGGLKPILDAMTTCGLIKDDDMKWLQLVSAQEKVSDYVRTEITFEDLD